MKLKCTDAHQDSNSKYRVLKQASTTSTLHVAHGPHTLTELAHTKFDAGSISVFFTRGADGRAITGKTLASSAINLQ